MTARQGPLVHSARRAAVADVVVVGTGAPALDAVHSLGLRLRRSPELSTAGGVLAELREPCVAVLARSASSLVPSIAALRMERPQLRIILLKGASVRPCPAGVDEQLDASLPEDELVGRIVIHLAHARAAAPRRLPVAPDTVLDLDARVLRRRGRMIHLRPLESRLLEALARSPGRPLSRDLLMERAWPTVPAHGSRTVDVHVRWLRQKLEPDPRRPVHLLTVRGLGYRLEPDEGMDAGDAR
ncbi:MAG: winged helix-turn-helix domain-containing protein [Candidatus Limnocylindrales bacterium]